MANLLIRTTNIFLWKHWKCLTFSWKKNILLILFPILLAWVQIYAYYNATMRSQVVFDPMDESTILSYFPSSLDDLIFYAPRTSFNDQLMENVRLKLGIMEERLHPFDSRKDLDEVFRNRKHIHDFAIIFHGDNKKILNYTIHTRNNYFQTEKTFLNDVYSVVNKETDEYIESGFLALQYTINMAFTELVGQIDNSISFEFEKFPANARDRMNFMGIFATILTLFLIYGLTQLNMILVPMVEEKADGVKEFLRIASSYSYLNNVTFFIINCFIGFFIFGISLTIAFFYGFTVHIPGIWLSILIGLYIVSTISFTFLISVMFDSVFYAKTAGFLCYMAPFLIITFNSDRLKYIIPLFNSALLSNGVAVFDSFGMRGLVFTAENLYDTPMELYSMLQTYLLLIMDTILYLFLYYYLSNVFPGKCGTPKPFYFPLMLCFNCKNEVSDTITEDEEDGQPLSHLEVAVRIRNLTKVFRSFFGRKVEAVKNLSMDIYKNQITVLLGHNGAGKTTTMAMITGIIPKTSGLIWVDGETNIDAYRHRIGYCPQHNVFMSYFTVMDHLLFFGGLRGLNTNEAKAEGQLLLGRLRLTEKSKEFGKNLSGGMKRRLCLGNALIGNTQIGILDEPSSGLDPESRRELWDILLEMRQDHTILLTTHYMEEAEILADKIAIIANGERLCYNTSLKLKHKYAGGYVLKLLTKENFIKAKTLIEIQKYIPDAKDVKPFVMPTLNIRLPYKYLSKFSDMLAHLEKNMEELGIESISITNSSLEDVFLSFDKHKKKSDTDEVDAAYEPIELPNPFNTKDMTWIQMQQITAIFYKKFIYMREKWFYWVLMFMFPIAAIIISFISINANIANHVSEKPLTLNLKHIDRPIVVVQLDRTLRRVNAYNATIVRIAQQDDASINFLNGNSNLIEDELLQLELNDSKYYYENIPAALSISQTNNNNKVHVKVLFSGNALHSSATALNLASNIMLSIHADDGYFIESLNEPLKRERTVVTRTDLDIYLMFLPFALFFYILFYVFLPFNEERTEFKKLQSISPLVYWSAYYTYDLVTHTIFCCIVYGVHVIVDRNHIFGTTEYILFSTIYLFYGFAYIPILYNVSHWFSTTSSLNSFLSYMFIGMYIIASFMSASQDNMESFSAWINILLIFPDYALRHALSALFITYTKTKTENINFNFDHKYTNVQLINEASYIGSSDVLDLLRYYLYMTAVGVFFMTFIIFLWENIVKREKLLQILAMPKKMCQRRHRPPPYQRNQSHQSHQSQIDVDDEKKLTEDIIRNKEVEQFAIVVNDLQKQYEDNNAVSGVNFAIKKGECFGLLGMNGAGKTTTFKIMTQQTVPSNGKVFFRGMSCSDTPVQYKLVFGYCPQVDALNAYMTAFESLKYMALIRGIPKDKVHAEVERWLHLTDLVEFANKPIAEYSGGTKRKLNTALAMIAEPSLVFLDEPTTGVDPISRRFVWSCIQDFQKDKKNVVLTSHSMDECEFLCNRLAIMANGELRCIGPVQQLKNAFGLGFVIILMLHENVSSLPVKESMRNSFINSQLREEYAGKLRYVIVDENLKWSDVFRTIQKIKKRHADLVDDVSVCETSLEDIFLKIARDSMPDAVETSEV